MIFRLGVACAHALSQLVENLAIKVPNETSTVKTIMLTNSGTATSGNSVRPYATKSAPR